MTKEEIIDEIQMQIKAIESDRTAGEWDWGFKKAMKMVLEWLKELEASK